ncbi:N-acetyltransferase eso1 [Mycoemilia scoparia]|uniref:DNA polymerase eta n=1 Tax=Mycoemilia scoparia TaxID=417184 RepID=A0A9W8DRI7_9FUNG|nr:N-acetyltransferase eso1 [Mycoemilia scoparia]
MHIFLRFDSPGVAKEKCPDIKLIHVATYLPGKPPGYYPNPSPKTHKASLDVYRNASKLIFAVFDRYTKKLEKASVDEAFLDLTDQVNKQILEDLDLGKIRFSTNQNSDNNDDDTPVFTKGAIAILPKVEWVVGDGDTRDEPIGVMVGEIDEKIAVESYINESSGISNDIMQGTTKTTTPKITEGWRDLQLLYAARISRKIRNAVFNELGYTCSAGIAHTKTLAKLCSAKNKPNNQTIIRHSQVLGFLDNIPLGKIRMLGGKLGKQVMVKYDITTVGQLRKEAKSLMSAKAFRKPFPKNKRELKPWIDILAADLWSRVREKWEAIDVWPKSLSIGFKSDSMMQFTSRLTTFPAYLNDSKRIGGMANIISQAVLNGVESYEKGTSSSITSLSVNSDAIKVYPIIYLSIQASAFEKVVQSQNLGRWIVSNLHKNKNTAMKLIRSEPQPQSIMNPMNISPNQKTMTATIAKGKQVASTTPIVAEKEVELKAKQALNQNNVTKYESDRFALTQNGTELQIGKQNTGINCSSINTNHNNNNTGADVSDQKHEQPPNITPSYFSITTTTATTTATATAKIITVGNNEDLQSGEYSNRNKTSIVTNNNGGTVGLLNSYVPDNVARRKIYERFCMDMKRERAIKEAEAAAAAAAAEAAAGSKQFNTENFTTMASRQENDTAPMIQNSSSSWLLLNENPPEGYRICNKCPNDDYNKKLIKVEEWGEHEDWHLAMQLHERDVYMASVERDFLQVFPNKVFRNRDNVIGGQLSSSSSSLTGRRSKRRNVLKANSVQFSTTAGIAGSKSKKQKQLQSRPQIADNNNDGGKDNGEESAVVTEICQTSLFDSWGRRSHCEK